MINQSGLKVRENSSSTAYAKYTFYLVYKYKNNGNQNAQMGSTFSGTVSGKLILEKKGPLSSTFSYSNSESQNQCDEIQCAIDELYEMIMGD